MKLLIDECLSPELVQIANRLGYEASHVVYLGLAGKPDWRIKDTALADDWTLVTRNSEDFRGSASNPGKRGQFANIDLHAGLICLNGPNGMDLDMHIEYFEAALDELKKLQPPNDLTNQVLEITHGGNPYTVSIYPLPQSS